MLTSMYLASIAHPSIGRVHGVMWEQGQLGIVTELCEGSIVDVTMREEESGTGLRLLSPADAVVVAMEVAQALSALHDYARTPHLDVSPQKILVTSGHSVRLGHADITPHLPPRIAQKLAYEAATSTSATNWASTLRYASPEQIRDESGTVRSDVYSLGVTLVFLMTGVHPFEGITDMEDMAAHPESWKHPPVPEQVQPEGLRRLLQGMVQIVEGQRPSLCHVRNQLHQIHQSLTPQGMTPRFGLVQPYWGTVATDKPLHLHTVMEAMLADLTLPDMVSAINEGTYGKNVDLGTADQVVGQTNGFMWNPIVALPEMSPNLKVRRSTAMRLASCTTCLL